MISIIILAYKNNQLTRECIDSILLNTTADYEIILVDNNSGMILDDERYQGLRLVRNTYNPGFARSANQGAALARGVHLLFLNNDTLVTSGWLEAMARVINRDKDIGIVGNKLLFPGDKKIQHAGVVFINRLPGHIYYQEDPALHPEIERERDYPAVTGACLLIRKQVFQQVGGFDTRFYNSYEDVDLCLKVRQLGLRVVYTPDSLVYHYGSRSPGRHRYDQQNLKRLLDKWQGSGLLC